MVFGQNLKMLISTGKKAGKGISTAAKWHKISAPWYIPSSEELQMYNAHVHVCTCSFSHNTLTPPPIQIYMHTHSHTPVKWEETKRNEEPKREKHKPRPPLVLMSVMGLVA